MKRQDKVTRFSIKKYSVGVASVAVAAFVFLGTDVKAADETDTRTAPITETSTSTDSSTASDSSATENKEITTPEAGAATAESAGGETAEVEKDTSIIPTPTPAEDGKDQGIKNIQYDRYKDLYKNGDNPGKFGLYLTGKDKDGNEVVSTAFGNSLVDKNLKDMNLRFVFQNDDADTNVLFDVVLPSYGNKNAKLIVDASRLDFENGIKVTSKSGEDYSKTMTYSDIGGQYHKLDIYKQKFPNYSTTTTLGAFYLQSVKINANDVFSFDIPVKLTDADTLTTPSKQSVTLIDFRNYAQPQLQPTFVEKAEALPDRKILTKPTLTYIAPGGESGGRYWDYSYLNDAIKDEIPSTKDLFRFGISHVDAEKGVNATLETDENGLQYYVVKSLDETLAKYNLTPSMYYFLYLNGSNTAASEEEKDKTNLIKILSKHGHTVNPQRYTTGSYVYDFGSGGAQVYGAPEGYKAEGIGVAHIEVRPAIITKDSTHMVDHTSTDWTVKDVLKQFSDPSIVENLLEENDTNNWINDETKLKEMKVSIVNADTNEEIKEEDFAKLKQKVGKYKVTASYTYDYTNKTTGDDYGKQKLEISNVAYVNVITGKQKLVFNFVDKNDPAKEVALFSNTVEGESSAEVDISVQMDVETKIAEYKQKGYKLAGDYEIPANFDSTANTVENVDDNPQIVTISFIHDTEDKVETKDATLTINYQGAGDSTPSAKVVTKQNAFSRTNVYDKVDKKVVKEGTWTPESITFDEVATPVIKGYTPDKTSVKDEKATLENLNPSVIVTYTKDDDIVTTSNKDVTRTITVTLPDGTSSTVVQKVTFVRTDSKDPVTDKVTTTWDVEKQNLPEYVAKDYRGFKTKVDGNVGEVEVTFASLDLTATVSYESAPEVTTAEIPFETKYEEDPNLEFGKTIEVPGKVGTKKITTTYKFENGNSVAENPTEEIITAAEDRIIRVGTKLNKEQHSYSYKFISVSDGKELPKEVLDLEPKGGRYDATVALVPELPVKLEVETKDGKWTFVGYTPSEVMDLEDVVFVGEWKFAGKEKTVEPTTPEKPREEKQEDDNLPKNEEKLSIIKEDKKLPNTATTDTSLPAASLGVLAVAAAVSRKRKNTK